jgi:hypothetical protein
MIAAALQVSATPTPTAVPTGPYHIATYALDIYGHEGGNASGASVRQLLTYAEDGALDYKALSDCHGAANGCKTVFYWDPNHVLQTNTSTCRSYPADAIMAAAKEDWFVHATGYSDSSHRVYGYNGNRCLKFQMNPNSSGYQAWWLNFLRTKADAYDLYFTDDDYMPLSKEMYFNSGGGCQPWPSKCLSTAEIPDDTHMVLAHINLVNAMSHKNGSPMDFIYQQVSGNDPLDASAFTATSRFVGMTCEGCVSYSYHPAFTTVYARVLNEIAMVHAAGRFFLLSSQGSAPTGSATQTLQRLVTTGFIWLGYKEGFTAIWPDLETHTQNLPVWPEDLIYPSQPLQSMVTGHADLEIAYKVYRREFVKCYQKGVYFGRCASVVNGTDSAITVSSSWLQQTYHHSVSLSGGDVLSGGTANRSGASFVANSTTLQAGGAILLTP